METEEPPTPRRAPDPEEALAAIHAARARVLHDVNAPLSYDIAYGVVCGVLVAGQGLPQPWSSLSLVAAMVGIALLVTWWRTTHGWWVNGYSPPRARWIAIGIAAVLIALICVSLYGRAYGPAWLCIPTGIVGALAAIVGGRVWTHVWRRELEAGG